jgi:radical SAM protein with 4Fe4S-binding SPASM domain
MTDTFCVLPFTHLSSKPDGSITPCCRSRDTLGNINDMTLEQAWNGDRQQQLRTDLLSGVRNKHCFQCWTMEDQGSPSMRQSMNKTRKHMIPDRCAAKMPFEIPVIELKMSNLCNFRCRTCKPELSTAWLKDWNKVKHEYESIGIFNDTSRQKHFDNDQFVEDILALAPTIEVIEFAGGEPLMDPMHYKVLAALEPYGDRISVKYSTNLSKVKFGKFDTVASWRKFRAVDLSLSIDGHPQLNNYIRSESETDVLAQNLASVKRELGQRFEGRAALCYSAWNVFGLTESYEYFDKVLDIPVHGNIAWDPIFINPQILPQELKQMATEKYKKYLNTIECTTQRNKRIHNFTNQNMNFLNAQDQSQHFEQFLRYTKTLDQSRNTSLVDVVPEFAPYV